MNDEVPKLQASKRPFVKPKLGIPAIKDGFDYKPNLARDKTRAVGEYTLPIDIDLHFNHHYDERHQKGDDNGLRHGIDPVTIESLVSVALPHVLLYSHMFNSFKIVNFKGQTDQRPASVIIQKWQAGQYMLNVAVEFHLIDIKYYEVTVITAMCDDNFTKYEGQYVIEILDDDKSILKRLTNKVLQEIYTL